MWNIYGSIFVRRAQISIYVKDAHFLWSEWWKGIHFHNLCCVCFLCQNITIAILVSATQLRSTRSIHARCDKICSWFSKKEWKRKKKRFRLKNSTAVTRLVWCWFYCRQAYNKLAKLRFLSHNIISPRKTRSISQTAHSGAILWKSWMSYLHSAFFRTYKIDSISRNIKWNWFWYRIEYRLPESTVLKFSIALHSTVIQQNESFLTEKHFLATRLLSRRLVVFQICITFYQNEIYWSAL